MKSLLTPIPKNETSLQGSMEWAVKRMSYLMGDRKVPTVIHLRYQPCGKAKTCPCWFFTDAFYFPVRFLTSGFLDSFWKSLFCTSNMIPLSTVFLFPLGAQMRQSHFCLSVPELLNLCWKGIQCRVLTLLEGVYQAPPLVNEKRVWPSECSAACDLSIFVFCFGLSHTLRSQALIFRFCSESVWFTHVTG